MKEKSQEVKKKAKRMKERGAKLTFTNESVSKKIARAKKRQSEFLAKKLGEEVVSDGGKASDDKVDVEPTETLAPAEPFELEPREDNSGVVYLSSLPIYMKAEKVRHLMEQFGEIGRVYLAPEDPTEYKRRKKSGGNRKKKFTEGWVEFQDKRKAKRVALSLNGSPIGGRKRHNFYRDDIWNIQYLTKFKWHMLKEDVHYNRHVRRQRLDQKISQARRENDFYLERVDQAKKFRKMSEKRAAKASARDGTDNPSDTKDTKSQDMIENLDPRFPVQPTKKRRTANHVQKGNVTQVHEGIIRHLL